MSDHPSGSAGDQPGEQQPPSGGPAPHQEGGAAAHPGSQQPGSQPGSEHPGAQPGSAQSSGSAQPGPQPWQHQPYPTQQFDQRRQFDQGQQQFSGQQPWQPGYTGAQPVPQQGRGRGGLFAGMTVLALVAALIGGGIGSFVGYRMIGDQAPGVSSLDDTRPARSTSNAPEGTVQQVADKVLPSVVQLQGASGEGSGMVISEDGYILTNNHVAEESARGQLRAMFHDNRSAPVRLVGTDPNSDLAVVKADINGLTPVELGRSDDLPVGAPVVAIGSPFGLSGTVTSGIISAKDRPVRAGGESGAQASVLNALQTDAAINPGNSGGPLVDMDGRVVGINSAIYSPGGAQQDQAGSVGLGFSIPIDQAWRTAKELMETGHARQTELGVRITDGPQPGAFVVDVMPRGAAEEAGVRERDLITKIDDRPIQDADALVAAVRSHAPGERVTLTIGAGDAERTVDVTLKGE
ncbi:trypsin-like peptidase domain-containing protein [Saccharopolyspora sp. HNM0983]|uniref:Trypsin-like peptidase domain-containing protein n=1 Tax=Saccharopolyspora montiporae TaxID=2781240 RepID=A0A929B7Z8_9PSEU|nr:trypsin-like peptidase domain-containing protein [Saccharopolyspora sp. HNM0983]MBE9373936.1 trypsin-like peptidase domain-containing protein [Saccharopolyspora sp. HNM0983]